MIVWSLSQLALADQSLGTRRRARFRGLPPIHNTRFESPARARLVTVSRVKHLSHRSDRLRPFCNHSKTAAVPAPLLCWVTRLGRSRYVLLFYLYGPATTNRAGWPNFLISLPRSGRAAPYRFIGSLDLDQGAVAVSYQQALEELPTYTVAQLTEIRKRCALLLQNKAAAGNTLAEADWVLEGILSYCKETGIYVGRSFHLKRSGSFASFASKSETLRELLTACAPGLSPVQYVALGQVCARELAHYIGPQVSFKAMMDRVDWIPRALNQSYPGYLESRLIHLTVSYENG